MSELLGNNPDEIEKISSALVKDDWSGAEILFLIQSRGYLYNADEGATAFAEVEQPAEYFHRGLQSIHNVGLVDINEDGQISLSESGAQLVTILSGKVDSYYS